MPYPLERRSIEDLYSRYFLEPTLRDIFVEGTYDAKIVRSVLAEHKCPLTSVLTIDSVNIPNDLLDKYGLTRGEKNELLACASELGARAGDLPGFTAVVDLDQDDLLGRRRTNALLVETDFTCIELYWLVSKTVTKFYDWIGIEGGNVSLLLQDIGESGKLLFLIRAALAALRCNARIISPKRYLSRTRNRLSLQVDEFLNAILLTSGMQARKDEVERKMTELRVSLPEDVRMWMHGHDLAELLYYAYRQQLSKLGIGDIEGVHGMIQLMLLLDSLAEFPMFQKLVMRCCQSYPR